MTNGEALLASILAAPDEDTPRLVYADWLDENDQSAYAEFIRAQIELAHMAHEPQRHVNERTIGLLVREKILLATHGESWLAPLRESGVIERYVAHGQFRRGFVEVVWMHASHFLRRADVLFQRCPVRELRITRTSSSELSEIINCPHVGKLEGLDLSDRRLADTVPHLLFTNWNSNAVGRLRVLRLRGCGITDSGATMLAQVPFKWPLRELDVSLNPIGPAGLAALRNRFGMAVLNTL